MTQVEKDSYFKYLYKHKMFDRIYSCVIVEKDDHVKDVYGRSVVSIRKLYNRLINLINEDSISSEILLYVHSLTLLCSLIDCYYSNVRPRDTNVFNRYMKDLDLNIKDSILSRYEELDCFIGLVTIGFIDEPIYRDFEWKLFGNIENIQKTESLDPIDIEEASCYWKRTAAEYYNYDYGSDSSDEEYDMYTEYLDTTKIDLYVESAEPKHKGDTLYVEGLVYIREGDKEELVRVHNVVQIPLTLELITSLIIEILSNDNFYNPYNDTLVEYKDYFNECVEYIKLCRKLLGFGYSRVKSARKV